ncbi:hypothetical protein FGO68_gene14361 [Halteria grandinella]|uniref:Calcium uniporter protein C-terminal domain-containing protein n=1 Tax=Halteria grandinella TaxID=5974 RepID=A0A8J8NL02_HALGN|nr:hypothetical protein FGO68_gene14361 [Halteria grandinella]
MRDQKAVEISRFVSQFEHELLSEKDAWTQNEILILLREVLAEKAQGVKEEKEILEQQLYLLKRQREPVLNKLTEIDRSADRSARRVLWGFASIFVSQFAMIQYGTYLAFSWDIMEPITCGMTLGDVVCGYLFWVWTKRPYSLEGLKEHFFERKKGKLIKKNQVDYDNYEKTEEAIRIIRNRLRELE